jgi:hypothetical protein
MACTMAGIPQRGQRSPTFLLRRSLNLPRQSLGHIQVLAPAPAAEDCTCIFLEPLGLRSAAKLL